MPVLGGVRIDAHAADRVEDLAGLRGTLVGRRLVRRVMLPAAAGVIPCVCVIVCHAGSGLQVIP
jgi:hypothetical protein